MSLRPEPAKQIRIKAPDHLPQFESLGSGYIRVRCRPTDTLAEDIAAVKFQLSSNLAPPFTPSRSGSTFTDSEILHIKLEDSHEEVKLEYSPSPALRTPQQVNCGDPGLVSRSDGPITNDVLDHLGLADSFIPQLHVLACTVRSGHWEQALRSAEWGLSQEQARLVYQALISDVRGPVLVSKAQYGVGVSAGFFTLLMCIISIAILSIFLCYY